MMRGRCRRARPGWSREFRVIRQDPIGDLDILDVRGGRSGRRTSFWARCALGGRHLAGVRFGPRRGAGHPAAESGEEEGGRGTGSRQAFERSPTTVCYGSSLRSRNVFVQYGDSRNADSQRRLNGVASMRLCSQLPISPPRRRLRRNTAQAVRPSNGFLVAPRARATLSCRRGSRSVDSASSRTSTASSGSSYGTC